MNFEALVNGEMYSFYFIKETMVLVSSSQAEYILYKKKQWHCADDISPALLGMLGTAIEQYANASAIWLAINTCKPFFYSQQALQGLKTHRIFGDAPATS